MTGRRRCSGVLRRRKCVSREASTLKLLSLEGVSTGHGLGSSQGERADRQRHPSLQETVREGWYPARTAQAGALRQAERATEEEGNRCAQARHPTYCAKPDRMTIRRRRPGGFTP